MRSHDDATTDVTTDVITDVSTDVYFTFGIS